MERLTDPVLNDCARLIERDASITPAYKARLLQGLEAIDEILRHVRAPIHAPVAGGGSEPVKAVKR